MRKRWAALFAATVSVVMTGSASAVIVIGSQGRNLDAPTGNLSNAGWQLQGKWRATSLGTPIATNYFLTAQHVGGGAGEGFVYPDANGQLQTYIATNIYDMPNSDLRLVKVNGSLANVATRWNTATDGAETGRPMIVFGRGTQRGDAIYGPSSTTATGSGGGRKTSELKGWDWGADDYRPSWGTNTVAGIANGGSLGKFVLFDFTRSAGDNEGTVSSGDSGGAVFAQTISGAWKLVGINYGVEAQYRHHSGDAASFGALFDYGGLYDDAGNFVPEAAADNPAFAYSSQVSAAQSWIDGIISAGSVPGNVPEPGGVLVIAAAGALAMRRRHSPSGTTAVGVDG